MAIRKSPPKSKPVPPSTTTVVASRSLAMPRW